MPDPDAAEALTKRTQTLSGSWRSRLVNPPRSHSRVSALQKVPTAFAGAPTQRAPAYPSSISPTPASSLKLHLDQLFDRYHQVSFLDSDPLYWAHQYESEPDQEIVACLAALLAYGRVEQVHVSVEFALQVITELADSPATFITSLHQKRALRSAERAFADFVHRFNRGADLVGLFSLMARSIGTYGSIGGHFLHYLKAEHTDIEIALTQFVEDWHQWAGPVITPGLRYFLSSPAKRSCCKRWCMFLRWMGRVESVTPGLDLGLWARSNALTQDVPSARWLRADQLVMPLDTHTGRISRYLGLCSRRTCDWRSALEVTARLKLLDPLDPTRYDFAIARLGILDQCQKRYRAPICTRCLLEPICQYTHAQAT